MTEMEPNAWVSEAVVSFLRGPLYTHPLMSFIDESCLVFTPEEENKFSYSEVHEEFKLLVDNLLTEFLADLGLSGEEFFDQVSKAQDQLSGFVVSTILTVDDFLMFKAMMVKRNIDLTNLVLQAVEEARKASVGASLEKPLTSKRTATFEPVDEQAESDSLQEALQMSRTLGAQDSANNDLQQTLRLLQLEDEDVAMAVALAASLKDSAAADSELADINQAIALSLALEAELRRMKLEQNRPGSSAAEVPQDSEACCSSSQGASAPYFPPAQLPTGSPTVFATFKLSAPVKADFASTSSSSATRAPLAADRTSDSRASTTADRTSDPRSPSIAAQRSSDSSSRAPSTAAQAEPFTAASAPTPERTSSTARTSLTFAPTSTPTAQTSIASDAAALADHAYITTPVTSATTATASAAAAAAAALSASLPPVKPGQRASGLTPASVPQVQVPLTSLPPAKPRVSSEGAPTPEELSAGMSTFSLENSGQRRGAGYSSGPSSSLNPSMSMNSSDLAAIREAAQAAAETQKSMVASRSSMLPSGGPEAEEWMAEQKAKLVAAKRAEREAETAAYKQQQQQQPKVTHAKLGFGSSSAAAAAVTQETEAKRAALRNKLAQGFKRNLMEPATPP